MLADMATNDSRVYSALLKHWRGRRGLSQLDLALSAEVSARHLSFLETGRARPSREMILRLGAALDVPLRDQNLMLQASDLPPEFTDAGFDSGLPQPVRGAINRMLAQHEPFPMVVMDRAYNSLMLNEGGARFLGYMTAEPEALTGMPNVFHALFDPRLCRPFVRDWERVARTLLSRLHRESLARPGDAALEKLVAQVLNFEGVPSSFRQPDFTVPSEPVLSITMSRDDIEVTFITAITVLNAPQNVTLEELRIESYFPADETSAAAVRRVVAAGGGPGPSI